VADLELERKEPLTRAEAAKRLSAIAESLAGDGKIELDLGGTSLTLRVSDEVRAEFEVEVDGDEIEIEIELKWTTADAGRNRSASPGDVDAQERNAGAQENSGTKRGKRT